MHALHAAAGDDVGGDETWLMQVVPSHRAIVLAMAACLAASATIAEFWYSSVAAPAALEH